MKKYLGLFAIALCLYSDPPDLVPPNYLLNVSCTFLGVDVPGNGQKVSGIDVIIPSGTALAQAQTSIAAAIRAFAVTKGYTVAANQCFIPTFTGL